MNQYGSATRTYIAPNLYESMSIAPPAPLVLGPGSFRTQFFMMGGSIPNPAFIATGVDDWNLQSNFTIRRCGLFSNFADGFVLLSPIARPSITIRAFPWRVNKKLTGTFSMAATSRDLVGIGTTWNTPGDGALTVGNVYAVAGHLLRIETIWNDTLATASQYGSVIARGGIGAGNALYSIVGGGLGTYVQNVLPCVDTLNYMYECERFEPISLVNVTGYTAIALQATVSYDDSMVLGTKSIDTAWASALTYFDVKADIDITIGVP